MPTELDTLPSMVAKRQRFDPLKPSTEPRWLARFDQFQNPVEVRELAPGTDLRAALAEGIERLRLDGWNIEGVSFGSTFVSRGAERHQLGVYPTDPGAPPQTMHGRYPGSG